MRIQKCGKKWVLNNMKIKGYNYKKGPFWIGWLIVDDLNRSEALYYENRQLILLEPLKNIEYLTVGLTRTGVLNRLTKHAKTLIRKERLYR